MKQIDKEKCTTRCKYQNNPVKIGYPDLVASYDICSTKYGWITRPIVIGHRMGKDTSSKYCENGTALI